MKSNASTSDINLKTEIRDLNEVEKKVATKLKSMVKVFKFKERVEQKGDEARSHIGFIAQQVEEVFTSEGLNAFDYSLIGKGTYYESTTELDEYGQKMKSDEPKEGYEMKTEYMIRMSEVLAFIISTL